MPTRDQSRRRDPSRASRPRARRRHGDGLDDAPGGARRAPARRHARAHTERRRRPLRGAAVLAGHRCDEGHRCHGVDRRLTPRPPGLDVARPRAATDQPREWVMTELDEDVAGQFVSTLQDWVKREVLPCAAEYEKADRYPEHLVRQMKDFGLFGARIPAEYGGLGVDVRTYSRIIEELAYGWMSLAGILNTHTIAATLIHRHGTDDQKQRLLPDMA